MKRDVLPWPLAAGYRRFGLLIAVSVAAGAIAGLGTVLLLSVVNRVLHSEAGMTTGLLLAFVALSLLTLVTRAISDISTNLTGQRLVAELRTWLAQQVLAAPVNALERYRTYRLTPILTHDVDTISDLAFVVAPLVISMLIAIGCFVWLAWLSPFLCLVVFLVLAGGVCVQYVARRKGIAGFRMSRDMEDTLHKTYRSMADGAKELKVNRQRRQKLFTAQIGETVERIRANNTRSIRIFVVANAFGSALFFLLIALVLFWRNVAPISPEVLSGFVLVLLFLRGPVEQITNTLPAIGRAQIAFQRIADLARHFDSLEPDIRHDARDEAQFDGQALPAIRFDGVSYRFPRSDNVEPFRFGPVDLTFEPGRITFIVGENGSGKTTLVKLLLGLYAPHEGAVFLGDIAITSENRDDYRQLFSTVLSDFHLFDDLMTEDRPLADRTLAYLTMLELAGKVEVKDGRFTTTELSTGQRKRLALVHALLEDRPIIVFDEWAADQDPDFRRAFYERVLPDLKRQGKTLIAISHDDRFFHVADRVVRLENGRIASDSDGRYAGDVLTHAIEMKGGS
ncbi:cyclic peptide export ABC transporter [Pseudochelatococcus sp. B33]